MKKTLLHALLMAVDSLRDEPGGADAKILRNLAPIPALGGAFMFRDLPRATPLPAWARDRMTDSWTINNKHAGGTVYVTSVPAAREFTAGTRERRRRRAARWQRSNPGIIPPAHIQPWIVHA